MSDLQPLRPIARRALSAQSDERLVRLVREGHGPAFEEIVRRYRSPLIAFAAAIVPSSGAEDVVQGSLARAHAALLEDERGINLRPWLFAIVRNGALNSIRGQPLVDELDEAMAAHSNPSEIAEQRDDLNRLVLAMCALPEAQRQALVKRELEGVGHGEIAAQLGTTSTAVRGLIFRARTQLRNALGLLVPLPLLRSLIAQGSTAGIASAGAAGGGASAALLGSAGAKGGAVLAAAVVAIGSGIAIEKRHRDGGDVERAAAAVDPVGAGAGSGRNTTQAKPAAAVGGWRTDASGDDGNEPGGTGAGDGVSHDAAADSAGHPEGGPSGGSSHGSGSGSSSGDSSGSSGHGGDDPEPPGEDDHSEGGHGSGHDDETEYEPPEVEEDNSGPSDDESDDDFDDDSSGPGYGHEGSGSDGHGDDDRA